MRATTLLLLALTSLAALAFAPAPFRTKPGLTELRCESAKFGRVSEQAKIVSANNKLAVIHVQHETGYGHVTLTLESGDWPQRVRLVFLDYQFTDQIALRHGEYHLFTSTRFAPKTR